MAMQPSKLWTYKLLHVVWSALHGYYSVFKFDSSIKSVLLTCIEALTLVHAFVPYIHLILQMLNFNSFADTKLYV